MAVSEAAMDEDHRPPLGEDEVWLSLQFLPVKPEARPARVQLSSEGYLRFRVPAPDAAHVEPPLFRREDVRQNQSLRGYECV